MTALSYVNTPIMIRSNINFFKLHLENGYKHTSLINYVRACYNYGHAVYASKSMIASVLYNDNIGVTTYIH